MQTLDFVSGFHNCLEFSQPLSCLYQAIQTQKNVLYCLINHFFFHLGNMQNFVFKFSLHTLVDPGMFDIKGDQS